MGYVALAELQADIERAVLGFVIVDEGLWTRSGAGFVLARLSGFVASEAALRNAMDHLGHLFFVGLARHLKKQRFRDDAVLIASFANFGGDHAQRHSFGDGRAGAADLFRDIVVRVIKLIGEALETVGFFERGEIFALKIFDQRQLESFSIVGNFLDARKFVQACGFGSMKAAFTGNDVIGVLAWHVTN